VIQADGTYQADPDPATVAFDISAQDAQDKDLKASYEQAPSSMPKITVSPKEMAWKRKIFLRGVLTVRPFYEGDRKKRAKSYLVRGEITLRIHDFLKLGPILEGSGEDGITDFRSLTYSLADVETAKQKTAAEARKHAMGRANAALESKGQRVDALRFANPDDGCRRYECLFHAEIQCNAGTNGRCEQRSW
jgi:uncharacterized protein YggE